MPKRSKDTMTEQPDIDVDIDIEADDELDPEESAPEPPPIPHHPDLIDAYDRLDYIAVDGHTLVAEYKFSDGSGIKAWTRDQGAAYATRHLTRDRHAVLLSGQSRVGVDEVNAEIEQLAADREAADD